MPKADWQRKDPTRFRGPHAGFPYVPMHRQVPKARLPKKVRGCQSRFAHVQKAYSCSKVRLAMPGSHKVPKARLPKKVSTTRGSQAGFPHVAKWQRKVPRHFPRPAYQRSFGVPKQGCHMFHRQRGNARIPQGSQSQIAKEGSRIPSRPPISKGRLGMPAIKYTPTFMDL